MSIPRRALPYSAEELRPAIVPLAFIAAYLLLLIPNDLRLIDRPDIVILAIGGRLIGTLAVGAVVATLWVPKWTDAYDWSVTTLFAVLAVLDPVIQSTRPSFQVVSILPSFLLIAMVYFLIPARPTAKVVSIVTVTVVRLALALSDPAIDTGMDWTIVVSYAALNGVGIIHEVMMRRLRSVEWAYRQRLLDDVRFKKALADSSWEGIALVSGTQIVDTNQRLNEMLGVSPRALHGSPINRVFDFDAATIGPLLDPSTNAVYGANAAPGPGGAESAVYGHLRRIDGQGEQRLPVRMARRSVLVDGRRFEALLVEDISSDLIQALRINSGCAALGAPANGRLSKREQQIAGFLAAGRSRVQIAQDLFIAEETVKRHIANIYRKMRVTSRVELVRALLSAPPAAAVAPTDTGDRPLV